MGRVDAPKSKAFLSFVCRFSQGIYTLVSLICNFSAKGKYSQVTAKKCYLSNIVGIKESKHLNPSSRLMLCDIFFALMTGTEALGQDKTKLPGSTVSLKRTCLFYKKKFSELGIYTP